MNIRPARPDDAERVAALLTELDYPTEPEAARQRIGTLSARDDSCILLAVDETDRAFGLAGGQVIAAVHTDEPVGMIMALVVARDHRRRGAGRALIAAMEEFLRQRGCGYVMVTSANRRADAHAFYESLNYERTGQRFARHL